MLEELDYLPSNFSTIAATEIQSVCQLPTLIHLHGRREPAVFVSILLHGNEDVGLLAVQQLIRALSGPSLAAQPEHFRGQCAGLCQPGTLSRSSG